MSSDSEFVDPADLKVERNGDGRVIPEEREAGSLGKVKVRPMTYGDVQEHFGDGTTSDLQAEDMAFLFNEFFIKPQFNYDAQDVEDMRPLAPRDLLETLMEASGIDAEVEVEDDGEATVSVEGNT